MAASSTGAEHLEPSFAPKAVVERFRSVHAFPMRLRDSVVGAMDVFGEGLSRSTRPTRE